MKQLRMSPRFSVNKLGQFLTTARPGTRRRIISDQKAPKDAIVPRYRKAMKPIATFLGNGGADPTPIANAIAKISGESTNTEWKKSDNENTIEVLRQFLVVAKSLPFDGLGYIATSRTPLLQIGGVDVSVNPDFIVRGKVRGKNQFGVVKLHFIKGDDNALTLAGQEYVAMICHEWCQRHGLKSYALSPKLCMSVDIFRNRIVSAPKATKRRLEDVEAACNEISLIWPTI